MDYYKTLKNASDELIIKKSRFKTFIFPIKSEMEAQEIISALRIEYRDATHVCYAYVLGIGGNCERFSDDGEPSGTAGLPMLEAIKNQGYSELLVAVVRYFGGIKLGGGGLIRAYAECVKKCLNKSTPIEFYLSEIFEIDVEFQLNKKFTQLLSNIVCQTLGISYNNSGAIFKVAVPIKNDFERHLKDFFSGRANVRRIGTDFVSY